MNSPNNIKILSFLLAHFPYHISLNFFTMLSCVIGTCRLADNDGSYKTSHCMNAKNYYINIFMLNVHELFESDVTILVWVLMIKNEHFPLHVLEGYYLNTHLKKTRQILYTWTHMTCLMHNNVYLLEWTLWDEWVEGLLGPYWYGNVFIKTYCSELHAFFLSTLVLVQFICYVAKIYPLHTLA